jgi:hypothetical protein
MPSAEAVDIMDGVIFHNESRTRAEAELDKDPKKLRLGDVFLAPLPPAPPLPVQPQAQAAPRAVPASDAPPVVQSQEGAEQADAAPAPIIISRHAFVVLSQACDLLHGDADRALLLRGKAKRYDWRQHDNKKQIPRTPLMKSDGSKFVVEWDLLAPETWALDEVPSRLAEGGYRLARRFRTPFALQLQQSFIARLGRVGTPAALPGRYPAAVKVFIKNAQRQGHLIAQARIDSEDAVCLVGRTKKNELKEWLLLSDKFLKTLREALIGNSANDMPPQSQALIDAIGDPRFYRLLKSGLQLAREKPKGSRPFQEPFNLLQVLTRPTLQEGTPMDNSFLPIVIEVELS